MSLYGRFSCMALTDLLQWLSHAGKTGTLEVERNKVVKKIVFRDGSVIACSSEEPTERLGHYLLSRGKLNEDTLRRALAEHEATHRHLGEVFVDMGVVSRDELAEHLRSKAEETIFGLFDWDDAAFRFHTSALPENPIFPVDLRVDEILFRGAHRYDEMQRIRSVFNDPGIVLRRTGKPLSPDLLRNRMVRRVYDLVTGDRSVAEILLHAHSSEYQVHKLLFELFRAGLVAIDSVVEVGDELDFAPDDLLAEPGDLPSSAMGQGAGSMPAPGRTVNPDSSNGPIGPATAVATLPATAAESGEPPTAGNLPAANARADLDLAHDLLERHEHEQAIDLLNALHKAEPHRDALRRLLAEAEAAFVERAYKHYLPAYKVPFLRRPLDTLTGEQITSAEFFLLSRVDGAWNVKSIIQVSPLREVDALRAMKRMRETGLIDLRDPD